MAAPEGYMKLGAVGYSDKGDYSGTTTYNRFNVVHYQNGIYCCTVDNTIGITPTTISNWQVMIPPDNGHTILNSAGTAMASRINLQFDGLNVADDSSNNKTVVTAPVMTGATALANGTGGFVPTPQAGDNNKVLRGDGTWGSITSGSPWGTCSTSAATAAKKVTVSDFELESGKSVIVKFANGNSADNITLNVNNTGAKPIYQNGEAVSSSAIEENGTYLLVYNGTQYDIVGGAAGTPEPIVVNIPVKDTSVTLTYDGTEQSIPWDGTVDTANILFSGDTATNAGSYTCTATLKSANATWSDDSTEPKTYTWSIGKATPTLAVSPSSISFDKTHTTDVSLSVTTNSDGAVTLSGYDANLITVSGASSPYTVATSQTSGTTTITVSVAASQNYLAASDSVSVTNTFVTIYGALWDGTSTTALSRTDASQSFTEPVPAVNNGNGSSPFDSCSPWKDIKRVTDANAGTLVEIPKFYYKWTVSGSTLKLQIADGPATGFSVAPAFMDRGDGQGERNKVYVGAYHCATSTYKSTTGVLPAASATRDAFRSSISGLGSGIYQWDYAMLMTIWMLYLVEYADWNSQAKIGYGCGNNSSTENMGSTDGMTYHTGTNAANRTTYGHVRYRYIEDLWGNVYDWCDGIYFSGADIYVIKKPSSFSDSTGGTKVGTRPTTAGYISAWAQSAVSGYDWFMYPSAVAGSDSTYVPDYCYYSASGVVLCVGGHCDQGQYHGLFCLHGHSAASYANANIGSRLQKLP